MMSSQTSVVFFPYPTKTLNHFDWYKPLKGGHSVNFEYYYNGEKIESFSKAGNYLDKLKEGEKYLVSVPEGYPKSGRLLLEYPVPDSAIVPPKGWDELPEFAR